MFRALSEQSEQGGAGMTARPKLSERMRAWPKPDLGLSFSSPSPAPQQPASEPPDVIARRIAFLLEAAAAGAAALRDAEPDPIAEAESAAVQGLPWPPS
jgi:hypothetical protein